MNIRDYERAVSEGGELGIALWLSLWQRRWWWSEGLGWATLRGRMWTWGDTPRGLQRTVSMILSYLPATDEENIPLELHSIV